MVLRVLSVNIPKFWEHIKVAISKVEQLDETTYNATFNKLLASLLSDTSQCFASFDETSLKALCITEIRVDELRKVRTLFIRCLYAFNAASNDEWIENFKFIEGYAKNEKCNRIEFETSNPKIKALGKILGASEISTKMGMEVKYGK